MCQADNGDYVIGGYSNSFGDSKTHYYLLRAPGDLNYSQIIYVANWGNDGSGDGSEGNPFGTIQHAVNQAHSGNRILIESGTYYENVIIDQKDLVVEGYIPNEDPIDPYQIMIDGNASGSVIAIYGSNCEFRNLTIQNGNHSFGGGILITIGNNTLIDNCIFRDNNSSMNGGGPFAPRPCPGTISGTSIPQDSNKASIAVWISSRLAPLSRICSRN